VRELEQEYAGKVVFSVREVKSPEGAAAVEAYGWSDLKHGMVTFDASGKHVGDLAGHAYGKDEVQALVDALIED
jgi:hypothetical protein